MDIQLLKIYKGQYVYCLLISLVLFKNAFSSAREHLDLNVVQYIDKSWDVLVREDWLQSSFDPKLSTNESIVYLPQSENIEKIKSKNIKISSKVQFEHLPKDPTSIKRHGLLYLPYPYVVPGGRFNEMYAWDSFFIELGLLENRRFHLAKYMVDNLIYEVINYGMILNANRTYYLGRTQPPLLTEMVLAYYEKDPNNIWLKSTLPAVEKLYQFWTSPPHAIPNIGLSRYYSSGEGQTPEESPLYYKKVLNYFNTHPVTDYDKALFYDNKKNQLTNYFYIADRTIRESGFDITAKYGPFGAAILDYAPVDLNVLLYQMECDIQRIYELLGNNKEANKWQRRAKNRANHINFYLWDEATGYYLDYNFKKKERKYYPFATTFYPIWAGVASKEQAAAVVKHLPDLLMKGGIVTSTNYSGLQWDAPFGWAPMQYFAVFGLDRYGYNQFAREVATKFIHTINRGFQKDHAIFEKYDVNIISTQTDNKIKYSYTSNEIGFGWTNGVYLILSKYLEESET
ncbi:Alpha,alpha-trehalase [Legionella longbeachae NSW150]|uniref:Alpha,alpha-trehalase n=1 Tax=Legionella longbeachae serogroup 1 (strain NSW150) TaxID=661367 RepID=D3HN54_LEGLN|nr:trehalase family glycosidase [Legionella longbeachae]CBJ13904.1 Alpha,alpha-trehalase [Legionella longbeachae NSW150]